MNTQKQKIASVGIILGIAVIIGLGTASYQLYSQPNNAEAEQLEETTNSSLFKETAQTSEKATEQSSTVESTVNEEEVSEQTEPSVSIEEQPVEQAQVITEEPSVQQEPTAVEEVPAATVQEQATAQEASAMTISMLGRTINYQNGGTGAGQSIIDSDPNGMVSTWGGSAVQSGNDGLNTHFIGHNPGVFDVIFSLAGGDKITITDSAGAAAVYTVRTIMTVDDNGIEVGTAIDYYDLIVGSGGGERVTFQSCITDTTNLIVIAYP